MVLRMPRWSTRDVLLLGYFLVWAAVVLLHQAQTGLIPGKEVWGYFGAGLGAIVLVFRNGGPGPGAEGKS